jgi:hypothetical protein
MKSRKPATGPNLSPLADILAAQRLYDSGEAARSLELVSQAVGSEKPLPRLEGHLDKVFGDTELSRIVLHLALTQTRRKGGEE